MSMSGIAKDKYPGPRCLGPFCIDRYDSGTAVFEQLGKPTRKVDLHCYRESKGKAFVSVEVADEPQHFLDNVFLSDFPRCMHMPVGVMQVTTADLKHWRTSEGIGLGSSEEEVIKTYGKPNHTNKIEVKYVLLGYRDGDTVPDVGTKSLEYRLEDRTRSAEFGIRNGKVAWIGMFR